MGLWLGHRQGLGQEVERAVRPELKDARVSCGSAWSGQLCELNSPDTMCTRTNTHDPRNVQIGACTDTQTHMDRQAQVQT